MRFRGPKNGSVVAPKVRAPFRLVEPTLLNQSHKINRRDQKIFVAISHASDDSKNCECFLEQTQNVDLNSEKIFIYKIFGQN